MRKNIIKITALALLSAFTLTSCSDDIIAKPTGYEDAKNSPVVTFDGYDGDLIHNNNFTDIYDSVRDGSLASDVLNELLYQYSISVFGNYNAVTAKKVKAAKEGDKDNANPYGNITLKAAVKSYNSENKADADAFIKAHSAYWTKNKSGERVDDSYQKVADDAAPSQSEYARLNEKWNTIEKRIAEKLYASISGGSYNDRNVFYEEKFLRSLAADIENNVRSPRNNNDLFEGILTSEVEDYLVFVDQAKDINGEDDYILHRKNYQSNAGLDENEDVESPDATYVEDKLIPDIYRQLLVEQYILDESYDTLGRTSARHVDVLSISKNANYAQGAVNLMNRFVNNTIFNNERTTNITLDDFKVVSDAWIGAFMSDPANQVAGNKYFDLLTAALPAEYAKTVTVQGTAYNYFQGTAYGDMMEEFKKIDNNPKLSENESTYTNSNAYTVETGMTIKTRELQLKDYTSTGWYVKSVGISDLPDSIKNQLFDINVANALAGGDNNACVEYTYVPVEGNTPAHWTTNETAGGQNLINVVGKIKGQYFLRNTSRIKGNPVESDILFESDGTYYIVLVQDAIRSKNLNKASLADLSGQELIDAANKLEEYVNEIVQIVADNDTYQTLSKKHWIEKMNIKHHDSVVYDFFKTSFPELFD